MIKHVLSLASLLLFGGALFAQSIPNAGFENWNNAAGYQNPDGWENTNVIAGSAGAYTVTKGTPGNPGSSYIKITSVSFLDTVIPGVAVSGMLDVNNLSVDGFPFSGRPEQLTGNWQYMAMSADDQGYIGVLLTKWNTETNSRDTIGIANHKLEDMVMAWESFSIPLNYLHDDAPDSAVIVLAASGAGTAVAANSYLYVDNLAFEGDDNTRINHALPLLETLSVFPVPASAFLNIHLRPADSKRPLTLTITDVQGRLHRHIRLQHPSAKLDIRDLPSGNYFLKFSDGSRSQSRMITIRK